MSMEPKVTPLPFDNLSETMGKIRQYLQDSINETLNRPEIPNDLKQTVFELSA